MKCKSKMDLLQVAASTAIMAAFALTAAPAGAQPAKEFKWRLQTIDQPAQIGPAEILPAWAEMIKKMSGGRLQISIFTAGQLVPTVEMVNALERGVIDIAYTSPVYYTGEIPESFLTPPAIPPLVVDGFDDARQLWWVGGLDDIMREAYLERGVYFLGTIFTGEPVSHWSRKPMYGLKDIKGYKVRGFGYISKVLEKLGATPVFLPQEEVYTALAQGVLDGSMTAATSYETAKFYESARYFYTDPLHSSSSVSMMASKRSWDQLPEDLRTILLVANRWYTDEFQMRNRMEYAKMVAKFDKMGATAISWPKEDLQTFRDTAASFLPEIAAKGPRLAKGIKIIENYLQAKKQAK